MWSLIMFEAFQQQHVREDGVGREGVLFDRLGCIHNSLQLLVVLNELLPSQTCVSSAFIYLSHVQTHSEVVFLHTVQKSIAIYFFIFFFYFY